jgi:KDO2-lipid IV(A) lauroyltransferase
VSAGVLRADGALMRRLLDRCVARAPRAVLARAPDVLGPLFALALPRQRRAIAAALRLAGCAGTSREVARVFTRYAHSLGEAFTLAAGRVGPANTEVIGGQHYEAARAEGRGVILLTAHTSGWYTAGLALGGRFDDALLLVMRAERDAEAEAIQSDMRARLGLAAVHVGTDPLAGLSLLAHLRRRGIVALQADRMPAEQRGLATRWRDATFRVPEGPFLLAAASRAPIVVALGRRRSSLDYELTLHPPIRVPVRPNEADLTEAAVRVAGALAEFVEAHPFDWFHFEELA